MGKFSWLKPLGRVGKEVGTAALGVAVQTAAANPAIGLAVQIAQATLADGKPATPELIKVLNTVLVPQGYMVVAIPPGN